jgi:hypothetical protein
MLHTAASSNVVADRFEGVSFVGEEAGVFVPVNDG